MASLGYCDGMIELTFGEGAREDVIQPVLPLGALGFIQRDVAIDTLHLGELQDLIVGGRDSRIDVLGDQRTKLAQIRTGGLVDVHCREPVR